MIHAGGMTYTFKNSGNKVPAKILALDNKKNVIKGLEVHFVPKGLVAGLSPDYFTKNSGDLTTCFKLLNKIKYMVYLIDPKTRGKIASREIDLTDCEKEIAFYRNAGLNAITKYIPIESHKISQFLKGNK
jgi:hypothetical protein